MAYSAKARAKRRCQAKTKTGEPCRQYAVWGDPLRRCAQHGGRVYGPHIVGKTAYEPCHCVAYTWPHRPGSGLCKWPDPPEKRLICGPSEHTWGYKTIRGMFWQPLPIAGWRHFGAGELSGYNGCAPDKYALDGPR